tara:strand:+ start:120 stop:1055 length:936 start_codon:yes stop_codon:yes gene_type:complete
MSKTILITGCCGFIGSNMCNFLLKKNYKIIGVDNLITGRKSNIENFHLNKNFKFIEQDICEPIELKNSIEKIFHLASPASPKDFLKYPIKTLKTGSLGTENILKLGLKHNAVVLVASTSEVYGDPLQHPQKESYFGNVNTVGPRSVYDEAKRYLEALTIAYFKKYKLDVRIARIFNTYGPHMKKDDGRAIPNFINQLIKNDSLTIYGDGNQTRSFCYIDDTVNGLYKLMSSNYNYPVNIGNPVELSINELVKILKNNITSLSKIKYQKLPENDPKTRKPDISLALKLLKWEPKVTLDDGLKKTINYFYNYK